MLSVNKLAINSTICVYCHSGMVSHIITDFSSLVLGGTWLFHNNLQSRQLCMPTPSLGDSGPAETVEIISLLVGSYSFSDILIFLTSAQNIWWQCWILKDFKNTLSLSCLRIACVLFTSVKCSQLNSVGKGHNFRIPW